MEAIPSASIYKGCADVTEEFLNVNRYCEQDSSFFQTCIFIYFFREDFKGREIYAFMKGLAYILNTLFQRVFVFFFTDYSQGVMKTRYQICETRKGVDYVT